MKSSFYRTRYLVYLSIFWGGLLLLALLGYSKRGDLENTLQGLAFGGAFFLILVLVGFRGSLSINLAQSGEVRYVIGPFKRKRVSIPNIFAMQRVFRVFNYDIEIYYHDTEKGKDRKLVVNETIFRGSDIADFVRTLVAMNPKIELDAYFSNLVRT